MPPTTTTSSAAPVLTIPQLALQEATGHSNVTIETLDGCTFSGKIRSVDIGSGNIHMDTVTHRGADGDLSVMAKVVIKGASVAMVRLPEVIRRAPFLEAMHSIAAATSSNISGKKVGSGGGNGGGGGNKKFGNGSGGSKLPTDALLRKSARDTRKAAANNGGKKKPSSSQKH